MNKQVLIRLPIVIVLILGCFWMLVRRSETRRIEMLQTLANETTPGTFKLDHLTYRIFPRPRIEAGVATYELKPRGILEIEKTTISDSLFDPVEGNEGRITQAVLWNPQLRIEKITSEINEWHEALSHGAVMLMSTAKSPLCRKFHRFQMQGKPQKTRPDPYTFSVTAGDGTCAGQLLLNHLHADITRNGTADGELSADKIQANEMGMIVTNLNWKSPEGIVTLDGTIGAEPETFALRVSGTLTNERFAKFLETILHPFVRTIALPVVGKSVRFDGNFSKNKFLSRTTIENLSINTTTAKWTLSGSGNIQDKRANISIRGSDMNVATIVEPILRANPAFSNLKVSGSASLSGSVTNIPNAPLWDFYLPATAEIRALQVCIQDKKKCQPIFDFDAAPLDIKIMKDELRVSMARTRAKIFDSPAHVGELGAVFSANSIDIQKLQASILGGTAILETSPAGGAARRVVLRGIALKQLVPYAAALFQKVSAERADVTFGFPIEVTESPSSPTSFALSRGVLAGLNLQDVVTRKICSDVAAKPTGQKPPPAPDTLFDEFSGQLISRIVDPNIQVDSVRILAGLGTYQGNLRIKNGRWSGEGSFVLSSKGSNYLQPFCKSAVSNKRFEVQF